MNKKLNLVYPAHPTKLANAIVATETLAERIRRLDAAVDEMPAKRAQAEAAVDAAKAKLAAKDVAAIFPEAGKFSENEISRLEADVADECAALDRLDRQSEAMQAMGATFNAELDTALSALAVERDAYVAEVQDVIADAIAVKAHEMAALYAVQDSFSRAIGGSNVWQQFARVSDPREARLSWQSGDISFDTAPNLLTQAVPEAVPALAALNIALEPVAAVKRLARTKRYTPRAQHVREGHRPTNNQE
ncbi:hypothetical protein FHX57_007720 [Paraburkholderia tropica]|uniref:hypothetical protein n=1 Tax=Paraburkholderia tropica TaxID=92647 RepID=UPI00161BD854|nr:hypothetical protein [Paraburkholderia tropica]MBB3005331.1 hypothetical protein [Paraburkholderia tropica]